MAKEDIMDKSPEMSFDSPEFQAMLTSATSDVKEPVEKDVKDTPKPASSAATDTDDDDSEDDPKSPADLEAQVRGLRAELKRRQGNSEKIAELEQELAYVTGKLEAVSSAKASAAKGDEITEAVQRLDDDGLTSKELDWSEELTAARGKYDRAEEVGNTEEMNRQAQRIANAKRVLKAIRTEASSRTEQKVVQTKAQETEAQVLKGELETMFNVVKEAVPEMLVEGSDVWKIGKAEYDAHPAIMKRLGPAAEIVAAALAIAKHPDMVGAKSAKSIRKGVLDQIDKGFGKALKTAGASAPSVNKSTEMSVDTPDGMQAFEKMVTKVKGGG